MPRTLGLLSKLPSLIHSFSLYISWRKELLRKKPAPSEEPPFFNSSFSLLYLCFVSSCRRKETWPSNWVSAKAKSASPRVHVLWQASQYPFLTSLCQAWDQHVFTSDESDLPWRARRLSRISVSTSSQHGLEGRDSKLSVRERHFFPILQVRAVTIPHIIFHKENSAEPNCFYHFCFQLSFRSSLSFSSFELGVQTPSLCN